MPFGKHKGKGLDALPLDYLAWLMDTAEIKSPRLKEAIFAEYDRRTTKPPPKPPVPVSGIPDEFKYAAHQIVELGYKRLASKVHPDRGGNHIEMVQVNGAIECLRSLIGDLEPF